MVGNILVRMFLYVASTYKDYIDKNELNVYSSKNIVIPQPELFVIYTGDMVIKEEIISFADKFLDGNNVLDVKVKIITSGSDKSIVDQYIRFAKLINEQIREHGYTKQAITETLRRCKNENVLSEYLISREREVTEMLDTLFDEERIMRAYNKELRDEIIQEGMREGMREGMQKGMREGILYVAKNLLALGLSPAEIAESTKLSLAEINALA